MKDSLDILNEFTSLQNSVRDYSFARTDSYDSTVRLLREARNAFELTERHRRMLNNKCLECFHPHGNHVTDDLFAVDQPLKCRMKHCSCPAFVRQT